MTLLVTVFYMFLAGANPPVVRASIMMMIFLISLIIGQPTHIFNSLLLAFWLIQIIEPLSLTSISFQLSFVSVTCLIFGLQKKSLPRAPVSLLDRFRRMAAGHLLASVSIFVGLTPLFLFYFNLVSPISIGINIFLIPVIFFTQIFSIASLLIYQFSPAAAHLIATIPYFCLKNTVSLLALIEKIPFGFFYAPSPHLSHLIVYYAGLIILIFTHKQTRFRFAGIIFIAGSILSYSFLPFQPSPPRLTFFQAGRSDIVTIQTSKNQNILLTSGRWLSNNTFYWSIRPHLMAQGINQLHLVVFDVLKKRARDWLEEIRQHFKDRDVRSLDGASSNVSDNPLFQEGQFQIEVVHPDILQIKFGQNRVIIVLRQTPSIQEFLCAPMDETVDLLYLPYDQSPLSADLKQCLAHLSPDFIIAHQYSFPRKIDASERELIDHLYTLEESGHIEIFLHGQTVDVKPYIQPAN